MVDLAFTNTWHAGVMDDQYGGIEFVLCTAYKTCGQKHQWFRSSDRRMDGLPGDVTITPWVYLKGHDPMPCHHPQVESGTGQRQRFRWD